MPLFSNICSHCLFQSEIVAATEEQSTFLAYEKRVKEAVGELTEQQAKLADYNLLVDKMNTDTEDCRDVLTYLCRSRFFKEFTA